MIEEWRDIAGYEGRYRISNLGRVLSLPNARRKGERVLRAAVGTTGYWAVSLRTNEGASKTIAVHLLVLRAFIGERPGPGDKWHGCHIDGDKLNNVAGNLRWGTRSENEADKVAHGRSNRGERNRAAKLTREQAMRIRERAAQSERSDDIAKDYGVTRGLVNAIKRGDAWGWV